MVEVVMEGPAKNALGKALMDQAIAQIEAANGEPLLIRGAGDAFSAGLNLKEILELEADGMKEFLDTLGKLLSVLWHYPGPTVAAVNGHAIAGGALVAMVCDHRVCSSDARVRVGLNEVAIGVRFPPFVLRLVEARLGPRSLAEVILGAHLFAPADALRVGLVDELAEDVLEVATARLKHLSSHDAAVYRATKAAMRPVFAPTEEEERVFMTEVLPVWCGEGLKSRIRAMFRR